MSPEYGSRFDWYELTMDDADDERVHAALALATGGSVTRSRARNGYATAHEVSRDDEVLATVYGHSARAGEVHVAITGGSCDELVPIIRRLYPFHRVSRADASVEMVGDFAQLDDHALRFATARGIKHRLVTDSEGGATRYLGAPTSEVRVRVYKKTEQLRALHPEKADEIPAGLVRYEVQVRPGKRQVKETAAWMPANDLWGFSEWGRDFAQEALQIEAERTSTHFRRPTSWQRALHFLGEQYAPSIARRVAEVGLDEARAEVLVALGLGA